MPEGDTIWRAALTLQRALAGKVITRFETVLPRLSRVDEDAPLKGRTVEEVSAVGKHLLMRFSGGLTLRTHMRMSGSWHLYRPGEVWQRGRSRVRLVLETADFVAVGFDIPVADFFSEEELARELGRLGPDVLSPHFDAEEAFARLRARAGMEVGDALLDQTALAGVGNVYKSEVLFLCGVHPSAPVYALRDEQLRRLIGAAQKLMRANVVAGQGELGPRPELRRTTHGLNPSARLYVYGRGGKPCRTCGTAIAFDRQGPHARVTYWCPRCQPSVTAG